MVDRRIVPDLRWIAAHFPIYVTDGYSGPLPDGEHVGCNHCHVRDSDHYNGLAVDLVPLNGTSGKCDASWAPITRLAHWAEPVQNQPRPPFRWVGYDGDAGHGCGNHLHLSWEHAAAPMFQLAEWVEVFPVRQLEPQSRQPSRSPQPRAASADRPGGVSVVQVGRRLRPAATEPSHRIGGRCAALLPIAAPLRRSAVARRRLRRTGRLDARSPASKARRRLPAGARRRAGEGRAERRDADLRLPRREPDAAATWPPSATRC